MTQTQTHTHAALHNRLSTGAVVSPLIMEISVHVYNYLCPGACQNLDSCSKVFLVVTLASPNVSLNVTERLISGNTRIQTVLTAVEEKQRVRMNIKEFQWRWLTIGKMWEWNAAQYFSTVNIIVIWCWYVKDQFPSCCDLELYILYSSLPTSTQSKLKVFRYQLNVDNKK